MPLLRAVGIVLVAQWHASGLDPAAEGVVIPQAAADGDRLGIALGRCAHTHQLQYGIIQADIEVGPGICQDNDSVIVPQVASRPAGRAAHIRIYQQIVAARRLRLFQLQFRYATAASNRQAAHPFRDSDGDLRPLRAADRNGALADSLHAHAQRFARCCDAGEAVRLAALDTDGPGPVPAFCPLLQQVHYRVLQSRAMDQLVGPPVAGFIRGKSSIEGLTLLVVDGYRVAPIVELIGAPAVQVVLDDGVMVAVAKTDTVHQGRAVVVADLCHPRRTPCIADAKLVAAVIAPLDISGLCQGVICVAVPCRFSVCVGHGFQRTGTVSVAHCLKSCAAGTFVDNRTQEVVAVTEVIDPSGSVCHPADPQVARPAFRVGNTQ